MQIEQTQAALCVLVYETIKSNGIFNQQPKENLVVLVPNILEFESIGSIYGIKVDYGYEPMIVIHDRSGAFQRIRMEDYYKLKLEIVR